MTPKTVRDSLAELGQLTADGKYGHASLVATRLAKECRGLSVSRSNFVCRQCGMPNEQSERFPNLCITCINEP